MLELKDISLSFNGSNGDAKEILKNINLTFESGKLYAITGPNGGGKTSIAKVIMGIYQPTQGQILFNGEDITNLSITERARRGLAYAFQQPPRFKGLYVEEVMRIANPAIDDMGIRSYLRDVGLCPEDYIGRDLGPSLSGGETKRLEVAQLLAKDALLTIFDEPEAGVDLWTIQKLISLIIKRHRENKGNTVVIISHHEQFLPICDEIILVADGEIREKGPAASVWPLIRDDIICNCGIRNECGGGLIEAQQYR
ncbi:MAG: ATP-binding cassette domain-containing protein [Syntrophomonadaceae bacterium]|nr:ATP-binding cassette domain-containing protein [Syntrophomonadaceae bacterium]